MGKIFISYARADDEPFVKQLYQDLTGRGFDIWWDRLAMESRGLTFLQEIREAIEGSDRLIAVIGPNAVKSEYVKVEWEHALLFSKGVVPILRKGFENPVKNDYDIVPPELSKFHCPDFRKERSYQDSFAELVRILKEPVPPLGVFRTEVPSLPPHFLPRRDELDLLGNVVLADIKRPEVVNSARQKTVIVGMGGLGKSVLAAAFARSTETRRTFTDGVVWISVGPDPDILSHLKQLGLAFNDKIENYVDLKIARDRMPGLLADKVCLIVLDDIWNVAHAEPFINALGPRCRLLITTRDGGLALEANEHRLGVLSEAAALRFLANWCGTEVDSLSPEAVSVAKECENLPFALALCGAMARDRMSWSHMLNALKDADLKFIEKKFPNYQYTNLLKSLKVSVDALANEYPEAVKYYLKLVVFYNHKKIPEAAIMTFWMHTDGLKERNAEKFLITLNNKTLLTLEGESPHRFATLHDLQHDYLLASIEGDKKKLHVELLEAYQTKCKDGWQGGPNDGYFFENLAYHLVETGRKIELRKLLLDFGWLHAKLEATDIYSLIKDYDYMTDDQTLRRVKGALRLSAHILALDKKQLRSQLYGRLMGQEYAPEIKTLLDKIKQWKDGPWLRTLSSSLTPPGGPLIHTLNGHTNPVMAVSVTPDGRNAILISDEDDNTLKICYIETGVEIQTLNGHEGRINAITVTPDGRRAISASDDKTLKIWDMETGIEIRTLYGHTQKVNAVSVTPDGKRAVSASDDNTLKVWDMETYVEIRTLPGHMGRVNSVSITLDSKHAISASGDKTLKFWDIETGVAIQTLSSLSDKIIAVSVTPDGRRAISVSSGSKLKFWDLETGVEIRTVSGHNNMAGAASVTAVSVTPDGKYAISASDDNTLKIWEMKTGVEIQTLNGHTRQINAVCVTPDGKRAISASDDKTLKVWDIEADIEIRELNMHTAKVNAVSMTPNGKRAVSASDDNTLKVWDMETGIEIRPLSGHMGEVNSVSMTPNGKRAVSASDDNTLKVWNLENDEIVHTLKEHNDRVKTVSVTPDGKRAISASRDNTLKVWDMETYVAIRTLSEHKGWINAVSITPDGRRAVSASGDSTLKVWDIETGKVIQTFKEHNSWVKAVSVTPDGRRAVSASGDSTLKIWNLETFEIRTLKNGHTSKVNAVCVTPDGSRAVSASDDKTLKVWDMESGRIITSFSGESAFYSCAISSNGKTIVAGEASGRVHLLHLEGDRYSQPPSVTFSKNPVETVVVGTTKKEDDSDKYEVLDRVLDDADFWNTLEDRFLASGKTKKDFLVAVKPNVMMFSSKEDMSVITDPKLVEYLFTKIADRGYTNIALVESQNVFGNWFKNREVENVAFHAGYKPTNYRIVDLTLDVVAHVYPGTLGTYLVGKTWRDADFRISFAKNKTHFSCYYTLTIKNIYGTTPEQNKFREYHKDREVNSVTIEMIREFPVHFGIIDGIWSADGLLGIKADFSPHHSKTIIAGSNIIAVDIVGGQKMGIDPEKNNFVKLAIDTFGMPQINVKGDTSRYKDWKNVGPLVDRFLDHGEELYGFSNLMGFISSGMDEKAFPIKIKASWTTLELRSIVLKTLRILNKGGII